MATEEHTPGGAKKDTSMPRKVRPGFISHTELASHDPVATKAFCKEVLGWRFTDVVPTPTGDYHLWRFEEGSGGGIRITNPGEPPMATPYCEVPDIGAAEANARKAGAKTILPPMQIPDGGYICIVEAPGGVNIGFWAPK
jgi:hypothetical protein